MAMIHLRGFQWGSRGVQLKNRRSILMGGKTSKFGSIAITLDEPYFVAGGYVNGKVHLDCKESFYAEEIRLIIDAKEWADIQDKKQALQLSNMIYGSFMVLHRFQDRQVHKGQYTFPFSFMLESYLPGTFSMEMSKKQYATIRYHLRTEVMAPKSQVEMVHQAELVVREINRTGVRPPSIEEEIATKRVWCFPKGLGVLTAFIDKNVYQAGETVVFTCSVDNMRSSSHFKVKAQLIQTITIQGQTNNPFTYRNVVCEHELPTFRSKTVSTFVINIPLNAKKSKNTLQPSTNGRVINCRYHIEVIPKYSTFFSSTNVPTSILPLMIQAVGGITEVEAPQNWRPTTFDSKLLLIQGREVFEEREGLNPYAGILDEEASFRQ